MAKKTFNLTDALDIAAEETPSPEVKKEPVKIVQEKPVVPETEKKEAEKIAYERIVSTSVYIQKCNVNFLRYVSAEQNHLITLIEKEIRHFEGKPHKIPDFGSYKSRLRVAKEDSTQLSVRMPESKLSEIKKAANYKHTSVSTFIDDILTKAREIYVKENV